MRAPHCGSEDLRKNLRTNHTLNMDAFLELFIGYGYAEQFAIGVPKYVSGTSGTELAMEVISKSNLNFTYPEAQIDYDFSPLIHQK